MLVIRRKQVAALTAVVRRGYTLTIAAFVRECAPEPVAGLDEAALEERVQATIQRGEQHFLETEWDLGRFTLLEILHGPEFDTQKPWAVRAFARRDLEPGKRLEAAWNFHRSYLSSLGASAPSEGEY